MVWTKPGIPAGNQNKSTEGARDGDIPTQRQAQGEWKCSRVHSHVIVIMVDVFIAT